MREILKLFFKAESTNPIIVVICLIVAGIAEGLGFASLIPLLAIATGDVQRGDSAAAAFVYDGLAVVGLDPTLPILIILFIIAMTCKSLLILLAMRYVGFASATVATNLRANLIRQLLRVRWGFFTTQSLGRMINAVSGEAGRAANGYVVAANFLSNAILTLVYVTAAIAISWKFSLVGLVFGAVIAFALHYLVRMARTAGKRQTRHQRELTLFLTDALNSIKPLKAMGREDHFARVLDERIQKLRKALRRVVISQESRRNFQDIMMAVCLGGVFYGLIEIWSYTLPEVLVLGLLLARTMSSMGKLQNFYQKAAILEASQIELKKFSAAATAAEERTPAGIAPTLERGCRLEAVSFAFGEKRVLEKADLEIPARQITVLTGPSGAGKTTITDLIIGLYPPSAGRVLIDDVPIDRLDMRRWRRMIGYVPQELVLFHDTVFANVTLGDENLTETDVRTALEVAGAWEFVSALPEGMMTTVGEKGSKLSGGQRQRITLSRALAAKPRLLILDEVSSALDPKTETDICGRLQTLERDMTILAVTHRPAFLGIADHVLELHDGVVEELDPQRVSDTSRTWGTAASR
jgi:ATP-binding cassette, subfamily C, bacterial